jgi:molybdopterin-synthase adenylyltransferase
MSQYNNYFNRQIQLFGEDIQKYLQTKKIAIIGCGGLGCSIGIALGASGIGQIDLVDFDEVGIHNIHRQIAFKTDDVGEPKCKILQKNLEQRCPFVKINSYNCGFKEFTKDNNTKYDLILDATDNLQVRALINQYSKDNNIPWIYGSVEQFHGQVCFFEESSFESVFQISNHTPAGITAPIVMHIASLQSTLALRFLANLSIKKDKLYYLSFTKDGELETKKFNLPKGK